MEEQPVADRDCVTLRLLRDAREAAPHAQATRDELHRHHVAPDCVRLRWHRRNPLRMLRLLDRWSLGQQLRCGAVLLDVTRQELSCGRFAGAHDAFDKDGARVTHGRT
jgi:hypothetical protein